jgi:hypothetical protein
LLEIHLSGHDIKRRAAVPNKNGAAACNKPSRLQRNREELRLGGAPAAIPARTRYGAAAAVLEILEKIVAMPSPTGGNNAPIVMVTMLAINAYSIMSCPRVSFQILRRNAQL